MPIYDRPTKTLMREFADQMLKSDQIFEKAVAVDWFREHYPNIKSNTVQMHVEGMSVNSNSRKHHSNIRPGSGHDLFYKLGSGRYRLWNNLTDPPPLYPEGGLRPSGVNDDTEESLPEDDEEEGGLSQKFAFERDLQNFLVKNLNSLELGLRIFQDEGMSGVEFPAGGRYIDILAVDKNDNLVVVELKVSRGHEKVVGQILRYMAWVQKNIADGRKVRGIIVASEMPDDIRLAASMIPDIRLVEYELSFKLKPISN